MRITIDNAVFCRAMILYTKYPPVNLMFFVSFRCWFRLGPGCFNLFHFVPGGSILTHLVLHLVRTLTSTSMPCFIQI